jgi:CRP-like cAMP-binding protein
MDYIMQSLKSLSLFADLSEDSLAELAHKLEERSLPAGEVLFHRGDPGDSLYLIRDGRVKVFVENMHGEELVLNQFGPGESFGEMALVDQRPRSASAKAVNDTTLLKLDRDSFFEVLRTHPSFATDIIRDISGKLRFAAAYLQKATEWSQKIAAGDYGFALNEIQSMGSAVNSNGQTDAARASEFLAAFFQMTKGVQEREENLKRQVMELRIEIDRTKAAMQVSEITETQYFQQLQRKAREIRSNKAENNPRGT